jgi:hypothetical protein
MGLALSAQASIYVSMAVPGTHNDWNTAPSMTLIGGGGNVWVCTQTFTSANGSFKFAANGGWATNWGGSAAIARVPATASAPTPGGDNLTYSGLSNGPYRITFNDSTLEFALEWAGGAPLPLPALTNLALVGDFNGWTPNANSALTNHPAPNTNLWSGSLTLENATGFQFQPNGDAANQWGAPAAATLSVPVAGASACGKNTYTLSGFAPGTFQFELNASNATFSVVQTATQEFTVATMAVQGNFIGTPTPPANMTRLGDTALWESDHHVTTNLIAPGGTATLRFAANDGAALWGTTNGASPSALPASGTLGVGLTNFAGVTGLAPGRYRITFNHLTGDYTFRQVYTDTSGLNLLKNPGFEQTTQPDGGDAVFWGSWQAWPKRVADGYAPHSGNWCGAIHGQLYPEWTDYGSFSQDVLVESTKTYRASAWFKATPDWTATTMQIKIEWLDATNGFLGNEIVANVGPLTNYWVKYSAEGAAPANAAKAHVVFLCSGAGTDGTMQIDDVEMRQVAGRSQNFDTWGALTAFGPFSPDWSITSGKVTWNVPPGRPPADVFISQYVEGTGNNKAIEIYNGTLATIALTNYFLQQYDNGATNPSVSIQLSGTLPAGETVVVGRPNDPPEYAPADGIQLLPNLITNKYLTFNGDDVVVLRQGGTNGTVKDRVGQVGTNASGSIWSRNTKDKTLARKSTVFTGTVGAVTSAFPLTTEWEISAQDDFSGLGSHDITFIDPNEPYTPAGYSLIMNTNAVLMSGELPGGIGDLSFWFRTESMSPAVTMSIETAPTDAGPWTTNATLAGIAASNFAYYVVALNRADALYVRIRQTDGGTNRFRIDEIVASALSTSRRTEDFTAWTDPSYLLPGNYARYGWEIRNGSIAPTTGVLGTRAAWINATNGAVVSPAFEGGLGEVRFWAKAAEGDDAYLALQTSLDGSNWTTQATFTASTGSTYSAWLYLPDPNARARIAFDPAQPSSGDALVDNVEIRLPIIYRNQNFDGWPPSGTYVTGTYQGWVLANAIVDSQNSYEGQVARLNTTVGNYVQSPELPDGLGTLSFRTRKWTASDGAFTIQVQLSSNGVDWTTFTNVSAASTNYQQFSWFLYDVSNRHVRLYHSAGAVRVLVDDIRIGEPQPRPEVIVAPGLNPESPTIDEPMTILADVVSRYGAEVLSVTGYYRIGFGAWTPVAMPTVGFGSYASAADIPGQAAGTMIRYYVQVQYAGVGAATNSSAYSTNVHVTATITNYVSSVPHGNVWINEIGYAAYGADEPWIWLMEDPWFIFTGENHEFVELCGLAGTDIGGWRLELAFGADADIALNGGQPIYATYVVPTNTVLGNQDNGHGFFVFGDAELASNSPIDVALTTLVPTNVATWNPDYKDHVYDGVGVVRLLNQYGHVIYSLSYLGFAPNSDRIPATQVPSGTNTIGLVGTGAYFDDFDFDWQLAFISVGAANAGQTLEDPPSGTNVWAWAWHDQSQQIVPANTNLVTPFHMLDPLGAAHWDSIGFYYGYTNASYANPDGTLYHRLQGEYTWTPLGMIIREGAADATYGYVYAQIAPRTYHRLDVVEYVIEVDPNKSGVQTAWLGGAGANVSTIYTNFAEAAAEPFTYQLPIPDVIYITNVVFSATNAVIQTDGNDFFEPVTLYEVRFATNLAAPTWLPTNFTHTLNAASQSMFNVRRSTSVWPKAYYQLNLLGTP